MQEEMIGMAKVAHDTALDEFSYSMRPHHMPDHYASPSERRKISEFPEILRISHAKRETVSSLRLTFT